MLINWIKRNSTLELEKGYKLQPCFLIGGYDWIKERGDFLTQ